MSPLAGHSLKAEWVERRSPNVPCVGDALRIVWDPPLPSGRTQDEGLLRVVNVGPPLVAVGPGFDEDGVFFEWDSIRGGNDG